MARETTPFLLSNDPVSIPIVAGVAAGPQALPSKNLVNSLSVPVEITELCFVVDENTPAGRLWGTALSTLAASIEVDLRCGRYALTYGYVPVIALGIKRDYSPYEVGAIAWAGGPTTGVLAAEFVRWILPRPFVVRPGESFAGFARISPLFDYAGLDSTVRFTMVARGRRIDGAPRVRAIPYASGRWYTTTSQNVSQGDDKTFLNVNRTPLHVSSLNARRRNLIRIPQSEFTVISPGGLANTVRREMVPVDTIASALFAQRYATEESFTLLPNEFLTVRAASIDGDTALAMAGYREEE